MNRDRWTYKKLGDIAEIVGGSTPKTNVEEYWDGDNYWVTPAEIGDSVFVDKTKRTITESAVKSCHLTLLPIGTVLLSSRAPIGKLGITTVPMYCNQGFKNIICSDKLHNKYVYYYLGNNVPYIQSLGRGATFKEISKKIVEEITIPVPPKETQIQIASEFDALNVTLTMLQQQVKDLNSLMQSIFYDIFGDPITNPKGWSIKCLSNVGQIISGSTPSTTDESNWDGDVNWVTPAELGEQLYYGETVRKLTVAGAKGLVLMPIGTVLLSSRAPIGKLAITTVPMCCNQGFKNIICGDFINNIFLYYYLKETMDNIKALGRGATFKEVSKSALSNYKIALPPLSLQQSFASKVCTIEEAKVNINSQIAEMQTLLAARMQYWFD